MKLVSDGSWVIELIKAVAPVLLGGIVGFGSAAYAQRYSAGQAREQLERTHQREVERMKQKVHMDLAVPVLNRFRELSQAILTDWGTNQRLTPQLTRELLDIGRDVKLFFSPGVLDAFADFEQTLSIPDDRGLQLNQYLDRRDRVLRQLWQDVGGPPMEPSKS